MRAITKGKTFCLRHTPHGLWRAYRRIKESRRATGVRWQAEIDRALALSNDLQEVPVAQAARERYQRSRKEGYRVDNAIIEANTTCNLDCVMCRPSLAAREKGIMSPETLDLALRRTKELGVRVFSMHTIGDPLMHPRLGEVLEACRKHEIRAGLSTNGLLLHKRIDTLLAYMDVCRSLRFSVDAATKEAYESIRIGGSWERLVANLTLAQERMVPRNYEITTTMTVSRDTYPHIGDYIEFFRPHVLLPHLHMGFGLLNSLCPDNEYFEKAKLFDRYVHRSTPCDFLSSPMPFILHDGKLSICCRDYDGSLVIGDIHSGPLAGLLAESPRLARLRQQHESGRLEGLPLCETCYRTDRRLQGLLQFLFRGLLLRHDQECAAFFQEKLDRFREIFEAEGDPREGYEELIRSI